MDRLPSFVSFALTLSFAAGAVGARPQTPIRLELVDTLRAEGGPIMAAAFAPDGSSLATGGDTGDLRVLDLPARTTRWHVTPSDHWIGTIAYSPDGARIACCGRDLTLHDAATGRELVRHVGTGPHGFAWRRDGRAFALARMGGVFVGDDERLDERWRFEYPINALSYDADGTLFAGDNVGRVWRLPRDGEVELVFDHRAAGGDTVSSLAVACAGGALFDVATGGELRRDHHTFAVPGATFAFAAAPDGRSFAAGGEQGVVRWWTGAGERHRDVAVDGKVAAVAFDPTGATLFVSTYDGAQALHRGDADRIEVAPHPSRIHGFAASPDGRVVAVKGQVWRVHPLDGRPARVLANALAVEAGRRDGELLVQYDDRLVVLDTVADVEVASVPAVPMPRSVIAAGPGDLLLVAGELVDCTSHAVTKLTPDVLLHIGCDVARANDGRWVVAGVAGIEGNLGGLLLTDATGAQQTVLDDGPCYTVAFSPDGSRIVYGCGDGISVGMGPPEHYLRVRDAATHALLHQIAARVTQWRFLDAHRALASAGGRLQLWDFDRLAVEQDNLLHERCGGFSLSEDRRTLVTATQREVRVHRVHFE